MVSVEIGRVEAFDEQPFSAVPGADIGEAAGEAIFFSSHARRFTEVGYERDGAFVTRLVAP